MIMLCDVIIKKGRYFYGVKFFIDFDIFIVGLREVSDGKVDIYVFIIIDILNEISDGYFSEILNNVICFMIDRSFIEEKVNKVLMNECIDFNCNKDFYFFKCFVYLFL